MIEIERDRATENQFTAFIDHYLRFGSYLGSYKKSFDILIKDLLSTGLPVDTIAYPILFIARHCMELGLKTNIRYFSKYSEKDDFTKADTHNLENLFTAFKMHVAEAIKNLNAKHGIVIEQADKDSFKELSDEVEKFNKTLHALDKNSDAFRYPVDKKQNPSFESGQRINIIDINELLDKSMTLFVHTADIFAKYTDYADEIESYYERLMNEQYGQDMF